MSFGWNDAVPLPSYCFPKFVLFGRSIHLHCVFVAFLATLILVFGLHSFRTAIQFPHPNCPSPTYTQRGSCNSTTRKKAPTILVGQTLPRHHFTQ